MNWMTEKRKKSCCNVIFSEKSKLSKKWNHLQPVRGLGEVSIEKKKEITPNKQCVTAIE